MSRLTITLVDAEDNEVEVPAVYQVCPGCRGRGSRVNPAVDGHGISAEEWANEWSDEEKEGYLRGDYDIPCWECQGLRVVLVLDEEGATPEEKALWEAEQQARYEREMELQSERRWGY